MNYLVSVIVPVYNAEAHIAEALNSVFAQTYRPLEIIVIDDGSTDRTPEIVKSFPEVRYILQHNGGPSVARSRGLAAAQAEYVAFLDADDIWDPTKLSEQIAIMERHPEAGLVFADMRHFDERNEPQPSMFAKYGFTADFFGSESRVKNPVRKLVQANFIPTSSVLARKRVIMQTGGFDEQFRKAEDWDLWLRMALCAPVFYLPKVLMRKRVHQVNVSHDAAGMNVAALAVLEKLGREHRDDLIRLDIDMDAVLRDAYRNLGYFHIRHAAIAEARAALWRSLSLGFQVRSLIYFLSTLLGRRFVSSVVRVRG